MSRQINSVNKIVTSASQNPGTLQIINPQNTSILNQQSSSTNNNTFIAPSTSTSANPIFDTVYVNKIYILDTLYTKISKSTAAENKLSLSEGVINNEFTGLYSNLEILKFNNVSFEPNINL